MYRKIQLKFNYFFVAALFNLALAVTPKMQGKEFVWDKDVLLSTARKCIDGGFGKYCKKFK